MSPSPATRSRTPPRAWGRETIEAILAGGHPLSGEYRAATDGPEGGKALVLREVIQDFRAAAREQLLAESEELRGTVQARRREAAEALGVVEP